MKVAYALTLLFSRDFTGQYASIYGPNPFAIVVDNMLVAHGCVQASDVSARIRSRAYVDLFKK